MNLLRSTQRGCRSCRTPEKLVDAQPRHRGVVPRVAHSDRSDRRHHVGGADIGENLTKPKHSDASREKRAEQRARPTRTSRNRANARVRCCRRIGDRPIIHCRDARERGAFISQRRHDCARRDNPSVRRSRDARAHRSHDSRRRAPSDAHGETRYFEIAGSKKKRVLHMPTHIFNSVLY